MGSPPEFGHTTAPVPTGLQRSTHFLNAFPSGLRVYRMQIQISFLVFVASVLSHCIQLSTLRWTLAAGTVIVGQRICLLLTKNFRNRRMWALFFVYLVKFPESEVKVADINDFYISCYLQNSVPWPYSSEKVCKKFWVSCNDEIKGKLSPCFNRALCHGGALGSGDIAPRNLDLGTRWKWMVSFTPRPLYPHGKGPWYPLDRRLCGDRYRQKSNSSENF
jgi:hypothetical protein